MIRDGGSSALYTAYTLDTVSQFPLLNCLTLLKHKHVSLYYITIWNGRLEHYRKRLSNEQLSKMLDCSVEWIPLGPL